jgi:hypothetical protein
MAAIINTANFIVSKGRLTTKGLASSQYISERVNDDKRKIPMKV